MANFIDDKNHYDTLRVRHDAQPSEIKQAYRKLVKEFHPDWNRDLDNHDDIAAINHAYEVLGNPQMRASYDRRLGIGSHTTVKAPAGATRTHKRPTTGATEDRKLTIWIQQVYEPIVDLTGDILDEIDDRIDDLAADPFDEDLMADFQAYLEECRGSFAKAQIFFRAVPNPAAAAGVASYLYHCLNTLGDGIEEFNYFTLNFDDRHLHTGRELWRRAEEMRFYARSAMQTLR